MWVEEKPTYQSSGGTKPVDNVKLEVSKQYTIAPAYNKGPSMVVGKKDIKDIGRWLEYWLYWWFCVGDPVNVV